jgi:FKBP-type peptidyl-prolyl cis-trans isomerase FkpA
MPSLFKNITTILGLGLLVLACNKPAGDKSAAPAANPAASGNGQSDDQRTLYALGIALSRNLLPLSLSEAELDQLERGLRDGVAGKKPEVTPEEWNMKIQEFMQARAQAAAAAETAAGAAFLAAAAAEPGATKLESGVIYRELSPGKGATPAATDRVKVHYHGTLRDGSVFDSSVDRGQPAEFALNGVIPCWTEGVQRMKVGGKSKLTCPADTAYGDRGAGPKIKPGAALAFEVELIDITTKKE